MNNDFDALGEIQTNFPNFTIDSLEYLSEGMDSIVYLVNQKTIFRFSKQVQSSGFGNGLEAEIKLLPLLEPQLSVAIPHFEFVGKQRNGRPFVGYTMISGKAYQKEEFSQLTSSQKQAFFQTLAIFFQQLHSFPVEKVRECGVPLVDFRQRYAHECQKAQQKVYPLLAQNEQQYFENLVHEYLQNETNFTYQPTLLHADLWLEHIFVDEQNKIAGIIDFGDMIIGDPDSDFMQLTNQCGEVALTSFSELIPGFNQERVKRKTHFFQQWNAVLDLLFYLESGSQAGVDSTLREIKNFAL